VTFRSKVSVAPVVIIQSYMNIINQKPVRLVLVWTVEELLD